MLKVHGTAQQISINDVRFGSEADIAKPVTDFRYSPESRHPSARERHPALDGR
jgi:hypothetical protein